MDKRGQVVVVFTIIIPIILLVGALIIDVGNNYRELYRLNSINRKIIDYGLRNLEKVNIRGELIELLYKNDANIDDYHLVVKDEEIKLSISKSIDRVFGAIFGEKTKFVKSDYHGKLEAGQVKIVKGT